MKDEYQEDMNRLSERKEQLEQSLRRVKVEIEELEDKKRQLEDGITDIDAKMQYINILRQRKQQEDLKQEEVIPDGET